MTSTQAILTIMQKAAQQPDDLLLGEWLRNFIYNLKLTEENNTGGKQILRD